MRKDILKQVKRNIIKTNLVNLFMDCPSLAYVWNINYGYYMSKIAKLLTSPGVFFRDAFIKKYPLSVPDGLGRVLLEDKGKKNTHNDKNSNLRELDTAK